MQDRSALDVLADRLLPTPTTNLADALTDLERALGGLQLALKSVDKVRADQSARGRPPLANYKTAERADLDNRSVRRMARLLSKYPGKLIQYHTLLGETESAISSDRRRIINVYICNLRRALATEGLFDVVLTHRKLGYSLVKDAAPEVRRLVAEAVRRSTDAKL